MADSPSKLGWCWKLSPSMRSWFAKVLGRLTLVVLICTFLFSAGSVDPAENNFIDAIQQRGVLKVGLPPFNTPPAYYFDPSTNELEGYDVDLARGLATKLGVEVEFDRTSTSFNDLVKRVGADDFDLAIGKLGLTYKRLYDAFAVQYLSFRHAFLANREFVASLGVDPDDPQFENALKNSTMRIGFISNSTWETEAAYHFPNAELIGYPNWKEAQEALFTIDPVTNEPFVDVIYRDATEIKPIVYKEPPLSLNYVPILFEKLIDKKSIYLSEKGYIGIGDFLSLYINREWGEPKSDEVILDEFESYYQPIS